MPGRSTPLDLPNAGQKSWNPVGLTKHRHHVAERLVAYWVGVEARDNRLVVPLVEHPEHLDGPAFQLGPARLLVPAKPNK